MCGIAGVIGHNTSHKEKLISDMVAEIVHRGPDEDGFFTDEYVGLGMRRLSIIDLSTGKQPIVSADGKLLIFFNGEIYNYKELHDELVGQGVVFKTKTDTEVILHMYELHGAAMLPRLRGMFTFCIYNTATHRAFLARDFFGIKPLYYFSDGDRILGFSSEIKSFLSHPQFTPEVNDAAVYNYLSFQYNPLTETFFKSVWKLPPGHFMEVNCDTGEFSTERYWSFEFHPNETLEEKETAHRIRQTIRDSVQHHMIADVPVGSFLSGGVDSSIIASLMQEIRNTSGDNKRIKTFTIGWDSLTEGKEAKETSDFLATHHTEITISPEEYFSVLPKAAWHFDEPVADPSAIGLYFVAREARKHVTVVLSGEGADELFGGYNIYLEPFARRRIAWLPQVIIRGLVALPFGFPGKNFLRRASMRLEDWYIGNASIFTSTDVHRLWKGAAQKKYSLTPMYQATRGLGESTQMQYIDIHTWLVGDILAKADKMTMAHSLELRVPFLDTSVAALASTLPDRFKWRFGKTKFLLREAFKKIIPETTRNRKKLGFPTPIKNWLGTRHEILTTIVENPYIKTHMDTDMIRTLFHDHAAKRADNARKIYALLMLATWYNTFFKK